jgi:two-component system LytT family sensor kinase
MDRIANLFDTFFIKQRWLVHVCFWLLILTFYVFFFGRKSDNYSLTLFFVAMLMPITIVTTYFVNYILVPRYLMKERYASFALFFIYTLLGSMFLETIIAMATFVVMAKMSIKSMSPASIDIIFLLTSLLLVIFLASGVKMLLHWRKSREDYQHLMREKVETELKFLKTQLNPHFLFNTLNNLYYLATIKSDKAPQAILALSEVLDYVLKEGKSTFVSLERELKHVQNYVALELLRYQDRVDLNIDVSGPVEKHSIGPMTVITLMENAFKHGVMPVVGRSWINMSVACDENKVTIQIQNSRKNPTNGHGIGLDNLSKQLKHLYGEKFRLEINIEQQDSYGVSLTLLK